MGPLARKRLSVVTVPPSPTSDDFSPSLAALATEILYRSPLPGQNDLPIYILNTAALPDINDVDYDSLLPYILARFPNDDDLIGGKGYEMVLFAGGEDPDSSLPKKAAPGLSWLLHSYHILSRALRKRLQTLYLVHERKWTRIVSEMFSTIVSPKFRRKVVHVSTLSGLALHLPIEDLLIPPSAYNYDRRVSPDIHVPYATGKRAFGVVHPLPTSSGGTPRLPRVLRETTAFVIQEQNIKTAGLFRINARAMTLGILREAYDRGQKFIVWKEGPCSMASSHWREGLGEVELDASQFLDGYSLSSAAGLIKMWYSDLRQPIFAESAYAFIERVYGDPATPLSVPSVLDLVRQESDWSPLTKTARRVLTTHLLPLLARIADHQDANKMTPRNLAVCFAPSLLRGPDPMEDARMVGTVGRVLEFAIAHWHNALSESCKIEGTTFEEALRVPKAIVDREDPLETIDATSPVMDDQVQGIILLEKDNSEDENEEMPPALPSRVYLPATNFDTSEASNNLRRKPVPPVHDSPGSSTAIEQSSTSDLVRFPNLSISDSLDDSGGSHGASAVTSRTSLSSNMQRKPVPGQG